MKNKYPSSQEHASNLVKLTAFKLTLNEKGHKHSKKGGNLTRFGKLMFFKPKKIYKKQTHLPSCHIPCRPHNINIHWQYMQSILSLVI